MRSAVLAQLLSGVFVQTGDAGRAISRGRPITVSDASIQSSQYDPDVRAAIVQKLGADGREPPVRWPTPRLRDLAVGWTGVCVGVAFWSRRTRVS